MSDRQWMTENGYCAECDQRRDSRGRCYCTDEEMGDE